MDCLVLRKEPRGVVLQRRRSVGGGGPRRQDLRRPDLPPALLPRVLPQRIQIAGYSTASSTDATAISQYDSMSLLSLCVCPFVGGNEGCGHEEFCCGSNECPVLLCRAIHRQPLGGKSFLTFDSNTFWFYLFLFLFNWEIFLKYL